MLNVMLRLLQEPEILPPSMAAPIGVVILTRRPNSAFTMEVSTPPPTGDNLLIRASHLFHRGFNVSLVWGVVMCVTSLHYICMLAGLFIHVACISEGACEL